MFERVIAQTIQRITAETVQERSLIPLLDILQDDRIPSRIKPFFETEVHWWLYNEMLARGANKRFDYDNPELASLINYLEQVQFRHARFEREEFLTVLDSAVKLIYNYLCRPQTTLKWYIFRGQPVKPLREVMLRFSAFVDYEYFRNVFIEWVDRKRAERPTFDAISATEFERVIRRTDDQILLNCTVEDLLDIMDPLFDFIGEGPQKSLPVDALIIFFDDKNIKKLVDQLEAYHKRGGEAVTRDEFVTLLDELLSTAEDEPEVDYSTVYQNDELDDVVREHLKAGARPAGDLSEGDLPSASAGIYYPEGESEPVGDIGILPSAYADGYDAHPPAHDRSLRAEAATHAPAHAGDVAGALEDDQADPYELDYDYELEEDADDGEALNGFRIPGESAAVQEEGGIETEIDEIDVEYVEELLAGAEEEEEELDIPGDEQLAAGHILQEEMPAEEESAPLDLEWDDDDQEEPIAGIPEVAPSDAGEPVVEDDDLDLHGEEDDDDDDDDEEPYVATAPLPEPSRAFEPGMISAPPQEPMTDVRRFIDAALERKVVKKIFAKDRAAYDGALDRINQATTWRGASQALDEIFIRYNVDPYSRTAIRFTDSVYGRYLRKG